MSERDPSEHSRDPTEFRPARESSPWLIALIVLLLLLAAGAAGWWYWSQQRAVPPPAPAAVTPQPDSPPTPVAPPAATGPQNPVDALAQPDAALPSLADSNAAVTKALTDLLSAKSVASFLRIDDFVRRFVATVDNLPRAQAPSRMWPTQPAPQRFEVTGAGAGTDGVQTIDAVNAGRYTAFVAFADSVDSAKAVAVYARMYPLFQQAYEELGYPGKYFNDRLVAVIDHLLQAPEPQGPLQVKLTEVKGTVPSSRPWTRYEFADPQLEALSSGQKLLVRMGPENELQMKAKLRALRGQVATGAIAKR